MRLIANKLFPETFLTEAIQGFAGAELEKLKTILPPPQVKQADEAVPGAKRARPEGDEAQDKADSKRLLDTYIIACQAWAVGWPLHSPLPEPHAMLL